MREPARTRGRALLAMIFGIEYSLRLAGALRRHGPHAAASSRSTGGTARRLRGCSGPSSKRTPHWCYDPEYVEWNEADDGYSMENTSMWRAGFIDTVLEEVSSAIDDTKYDPVWDQLEAILKQQYAAAGLAGYGAREFKSTRCP